MNEKHFLKKKKQRELSSQATTGAEPAFERLKFESV